MLNIDQFFIKKLIHEHFNLTFISQYEFIRLKLHLNLMFSLTTIDIIIYMNININKSI